ncbi:MAG: polyphosphate kinase [Bacteroidetes bacterium]|nr:polyphosphate kinase [Bacteroidota bacterium]
MAVIKLDKISTRAPKGLRKEKIKAETQKILEQLDELQNLLYAESKHSVLVVIQGMDASGKDGLIRNVLGQMNPQGVMVQSFKVPTAEELSHDFLWRIHKHTPAKGMIQVLNRSHYEDILVTRVHKLIDDTIANERIKAINDFEEMLVKHNNTTILKFYLHVSPEEQQQRLKERITDKTKEWKYNENDFKEANQWKEYMKVYHDAFTHCNKIKWHIIPSDQNWYKEYMAATLLYEALKELDMHYPQIKNNL